MNDLRTAYILLACVAVACLAAFVFLPLDQEGWRSFALNGLTDALAIGFTVGLIDSAIRRKEEREQRKYRSIAVRQLYVPLYKHFSLLFQIYKASVAQKPDRTISRVEDLLVDDYFEQIVHFDLMSLGPATRGGSFERMPWFEYLALEVQQFKDDVGRIVDKYAMYLDSDTLDLMERLISSRFVQYVTFAPTTTALIRSEGLQGPLNHFALERDNNVVRDHARIFCKLVDIYNAEAPSDRQIVVVDSWGNDVHPLIGSARAPIVYTHPADAEENLGGPREATE